jgi:hypothetical protein
MNKLLILAVAVCVPALAPAQTLFDAQGFESPTYSLGVLAGQDGWLAENSGANPDPVVIADPTGAGMGQVLMLDPTSDEGGWSGVVRSFVPSAGPMVVIEWDQYRVDTGDNFWYADDAAYDGWVAMQWDQNGQASALNFDFGVALTTGQWQHVTYTLDLVAQTSMVDIDGTSFMSPNPMTDASIGGIDLEVESTFQPGDGPVYVDNLVLTQVPEPGIMLMGALGLLLAIRRRAR